MMAAAIHVEKIEIEVSCPVHSEERESAEAEMGGF